MCPQHRKRFIGQRLLGANKHSIAAVATALSFWLAASCAAPTDVVAGQLDIYAATDWYRASEATEIEIRGRLQRNDYERGPGNRPARRYRLSNRTLDLPVYAAEPVGALEERIGQNICANAKIIDLTDEGFNKEIWIGSLCG